MIYLVDTDVLLRVIDRKDPANINVVASLRKLHQRGDDLVTSPQNLREMWSVLTCPKTARGGYGRSVRLAARWIRISQRLLRPVPETNGTFKLWAELVESAQVRGSQVHDAHIAAIMESHEVVNILTLNADDFRRFSKVRPITPDEIPASP